MKLKTNEMPRLRMNPTVPLKGTSAGRGSGGLRRRQRHLGHGFPDGGEASGRYHAALHPIDRWLISRFVGGCVWLALAAVVYLLVKLLGAG